MKILILILMTFILLKANGQNVKVDSIYKTSRIDTVVKSDLSKDDIFSNSLKYIQNSTKYDPKLIITADQSLGEISFTGNTSKEILKHNKTGDKGVLEIVRLYYKGFIYVKEKRFKITLNSLEYQYGIISPSDVLNNQVSFIINKTNISIDEKSIENISSKELALWFLKDIAKKINTKPERDF